MKALQITKENILIGLLMIANIMKKLIWINYFDKYANVLRLLETHTLLKRWVLSTKYRFLLSLLFFEGY